MPKEVVLFSSYSPDLGGGGTNLRSLIPELQAVNVRWLYTAPKEATFPGTRRLSGPMAGGSPWHDLSRAVSLWSGVPTRTFSRVVAALTAAGDRRFWVVGHNEGIVVARALARAGARVHLTIQDDVPDGMFGRSQRYRALVPLVRRVYQDTLRRMVSIDVTSDGMATYYRQQLGLSSVVVHPLVKTLPPAPPIPAPDGELRVGHIGSIYAADEWRAMLRALVSVAARRGLRARMLMIGLAPKFRPVATEFGDVVQLISDLPEEQAVERLFTCHFLYAMYPFDARSDVFRRTSLPTKITSYLKCQRPILAHAPADSTLLDVVRRYGLGVSCTSAAVGAIEAAIDQLGGTAIAPEVYERAREEVYGRGNVQRLSACLEAL